MRLLAYADRALHTVIERLAGPPVDPVLPGTVPSRPGTVRRRPRTR